MQAYHGALRGPTNNNHLQQHHVSNHNRAPIDVEDLDIKLNDTTGTNDIDMLQETDD